MRKYFFLCSITLLFFIFFPYKVMAFKIYEGKVVGIQESRAFRQNIYVQGYDGSEIVFLVGIRTKYNPRRMPLVGERIKVEYLDKKGWHIGYVITILSNVAPAPQPAPVLNADITLSGQLSVISKQANIRSGPGMQYQIIADTNEGQLLILKGQTGSWYYILLPDQQLSGWIYSELVRVNNIEVPSQPPKESLPSEPEEPQSF